MLAADGLLGPSLDEGADDGADADEGEGEGDDPASATRGGPRVLDLYAGSGALAFEALSRGASAAVLVESGRDAVACIKTNARALDALSLVTVFDAKVERAIARIQGTFGVVFLDPPYADVTARGFADVLGAAARLVDEAGALVLEHASSDAPPAIAGLDLDRSRRYGDTTVTLYARKRSGVEEGPEMQNPANDSKSS